MLNSRKVLEIGRAIGDLRRGVPVLVESVAFYALETHLDSLSNKILAVPSCAIQSNANSKFIFFDVEGLTTEDLSSSLLNNDFSKLSVSKKSFDLSSVDSVVKLVKKSELLPFVLISDGKLEGAIELSSKDIQEYIDNAENNVYKTAEANLNLKHASKAKILCFRSRLTAQDHYAIVIGDLSKTKDPCVRIHSSCYTGDLMASLSCDCRDQLLDTVKFMSESEENAGVILYLMQEGRGIGLTNKIRTYKLQQEGADTIEANNLIGFEEDERNFDAAYKILESMDIDSVKLLTNNPNKVKSLESRGIKISKTISLYGNINKYNKSYLETKKDKMGHNL